MKIQLFTIPISKYGNSLDEMNNFLENNKVLEIKNELVNNNDGAYWCFCIKYIKENYGNNGNKNNVNKVDYRKVLDEETFNKFSKLRELRKKVAVEEGIPAYAVFNDEELVGLAKLENINEKNMLTVKGIGAKKIERFLKYFKVKDGK